MVYVESHSLDLTSAIHIMAHIETRSLDLTSNPTFAQAKRDPTHYTTKVRETMRHFDVCWTNFEVCGGPNFRCVGQF